MLRRGFRVPPNAKEFPAASLDAIRAYRPDAFVAPLNIALMLAGEKLGGRFDLPSLEIAIAVVTRTDDAPLAGHHRELLWQAFGVPIFEMLASADGRVIARECEVHDGLHIDVAAPRDEGEVTAEPCDCGAQSPRLRRALLSHVQV